MPSTTPNDTSTQPASEELPKSHDSPSPRSHGEATSGAQLAAKGPTRDRLWRVANSAKGLAVALAIGVVATYVIMSHGVHTAATRGALAKSAPGSVTSPAGAVIPVYPLNSTPAAASIEGPRVALVIGNINYRYVDHLTNPSNDARLMATRLQRLDFKLVGGGAQTDLNKSTFEGK